MKDLLRMLLKLFLYLAVTALIVVLVFGLVIFAGWPWWVGAFILIGLLGIVLAIVLARKIWSRRRERMFIHQIIQQDESMRKGMALKEQDSARELQARWKEAVDALRSSHLRKQGNPLYVLPWYMVIGESGSGKTTAIQSARLSSPFAQVSRTSGISGTRNCDWWFFEQAILIDTAGRYAIPVDQDRDKDEWQKFLTLLAKFRKKEPLNGLVVTVAADHLTRSTPEALQAEGRSIRSRVEELMRMLGARFPVYVLVTKCDLVQGASQFCESLPEKALQQAMGLVNQELSGDAAGFAATTFATVSERLRELRLLLLNKTRERSAASAMLIFPEEFERLQDPLTVFVGGAFQENAYQETPLLRGIFFSSGRQEGTPFSHFLGALGLIREREVLGGTNKGLFLHDFFAKILPTDRHLFRPTQHMREWRVLTRNLGLTAWLAIMVALCGYLSFIFVKNLNALSDVRREFRNAAVLQGELTTDVSTMDRFREALLKIGKQNDQRWMWRMGLDESLEIESKLKQKYVRMFHSGFLNDFDKATQDRMTRFDPHTPYSVLGVHVTHLVRRINLLRARLAREGIENLTSLPQPGFEAVLLDRDRVLPEIESQLGRQYLYSIVWQQDGDLLNKELSGLQNWLKHILTRPGTNLNWLVDWANIDSNVQPLLLSDFWGGMPPADQANIVPAYTQEGKERIESALAEIESALFDPLIIAAQKLEFTTWYRQSYYKTWKDFVSGFENGSKMLQGRDQWQTVARRIATLDGPYFALIDRIAEEFEPFEREAEVPAWAGLAFDWQIANQEIKDTTSAVDLEKSGIIKKATRKVQSNIRKAEQALGVKIRKPMDSKAQLEAAKAGLAYRQALEQTVKSAESRNVAFTLASELYKQDPATGESPFLAASRALQPLKKAMAPKPTAEDRIFWSLLEANIRFMHRYALQEAACYVQERWEKDVLVEVEGVSQEKNLAELLMGQNGYATKFLQTVAEPFLSRSLAKGYSAKRVFDQEMAFDKGFFAYLTKGARAARPTQSSYTIRISTAASDYNRDAKVQPHMTVLEYQCSDTRMRLENLNYPIARNFTWSPQGCGDVLFQIAVGNVVLTRTYSGHNAFPKFLNDFKTGERVFYPKEFPNEEAALQRMGIEFIKARYQFQGHEPILRLLYEAPGAAPRRVVACWDR
jgi:type VI secretion system protein ImpL